MHEDSASTFIRVETTNDAQRLVRSLSRLVGRFNMAIRIISFLGGVILGGGGAILSFNPPRWGIVGLVALITGLLAALFARKFWDIVMTIWANWV